MAFWKRKATAEEPSGSSPLSLGGVSMTGEDDSTPQPAQAQEWTKGSELKTRAVKAGIWSGIFVWPVAVAIVLGAGGSPTKADVTEGVRPGITEQSAGAVASGFVGAWLSSTKTDPSALKQFVDPSTLTLNDQPWEYKNLSVVSATDPGPGGLIAVKVSAEVKESALDGEGSQPRSGRNGFSMSPSALMGLPSESWAYRPRWPGRTDRHPILRWCTDPGFLHRTLLVRPSSHSSPLISRETVM